jgi:hypothetical protein
MKDKHGTNYRPVLKIVQWADRPVDLPDASPVDEQEIWQGGPAPQAPAKAPAQHVPPPAPKSEPLGEVLF